MKYIKHSFVILFLTACFSVTSLSQTAFNANDYKQFLNSHSNMSYDELTAMYPAGVFTGNAHAAFQSALYFDSINVKYNLTEYEKSLIGKNGFMVSERLNNTSFGNAYLDIFQKDLPLFISTDAILHAFHMSYDAILKDVELYFIIDKVKNLLLQLHQNIPVLASKYSSESRMTQMLKDVDIYITVPLMLLGENIQPYFPDNIEKINDIMAMIDKETACSYSLFSQACVTYDWSQFKPRGHYIDRYSPMLEKYFRTMMWLGKIEVYLLPPNAVSGFCPKQSFYDIQRQFIDAILITELFDEAQAYSEYQEIESVLRFFIGEQDNVTIPDLYYLKGLVSSNNAADLLDSLKCIEFMDTLKVQSFSGQKILSCLLSEDPMKPDSIVPASSFMLFGQRFVIDSYVTGSVVYDRIRYNGNPVCRLAPSSLDIMFALGNNAAAQLLKDEITLYNYSSNLAALRYLINSYPDSFWNSSLYNLWLNSIRELNPPIELNNLPSFMMTGAFWQEKLNTQLGSWTELRHDNILYAKQSYTGMTLCSYPFTYLEPFPKLYRSLKNFMLTAKSEFSKINFSNSYIKDAISDYFDTFSTIADTLTGIAQKELDGAPFDSAEVSFLKRVMYNTEGQSGSMPFDGWYARLFFNDHLNGYKDATFPDYIVADVHTIPTDCFGQVTGWVNHVGTGDINLGVFIAKMQDGRDVAFVGPVMGYHEYTTTNFNRLTDKEWKDTYLQQSLRPGWVNIYLAGKNGETLGTGAELITSIKDNSTGAVPRQSKITAQNYPNPFNPSTIISFNVPANLSGSLTRLIIYDVQGRQVKLLLNNNLPANNYLTKWDGTAEDGRKVSSGVYIYRIMIGDKQFTGKMNLIR